MMSNELSKQEYLKRYLEKEKDPDRKRKKKPKKKVQVSSLKIVDEDISLKLINFGDKVEEEEDEQPIVAEVIDERPIEDKMNELYESSRWKRIDDESSRIDSVAELKDNDFVTNSVSLKEKSSFGKNAFSKSSHRNSKNLRHDSDSDLSPPRVQEKANIKHRGSNDLSPQREHKKNFSDSDLSPQREHKRNLSDSDLSPQRCQKRNLSDSDISPPPSHKPRKSRKDSDSDISPPPSHKPRKSKSRKDTDRDISPRYHKFPNKSNSPVRTKSKKYESDSDISPPRHYIASTSFSQKTHRSKKYNQNKSTPSPNHQNGSKPKIQKRSGRHDSDDESLSKNQMHLLSKVNNSSSSISSMERNSDSVKSLPRSTLELSSIGKTEKVCKTLSGLKAGLQNSKTLQKEMVELREREKKQMSRLDDKISGRNASTVVRDRKTGLKRDMKMEADKKNEEDKKTKEYQQKYAQWGKGMEQTVEKKDKLIDDIYEMSKPLARYKDDEDLDERLKAIIHDEDPMSEYIKKKKFKTTPKYPVYSGPQAPPNRFGILPGYRWDGVDRSNGFEKKYFEKVNKSKAVETEAYMWSVQDM